MKRLSARLAALFVLLVSTSLPLANAQAQEFVWAPALPVGSMLPPLDAVDQNGQRHTLADLTGSKGLILIMSRSFDWCPYCKAQLERMQAAQEQFAALGFTLAAMTYDPVATLKEAEEEHGTSMPLLSDEDTRHVTAMGILNTQYSPGERAYGIPYPGIFVIDAQGVIRAKLAEKDYKVRPDVSLVLETVSAL
jgi:peroxiredoxin